MLTRVPCGSLVAGGRDSSWAYLVALFGLATVGISHRADAAKREGADHSVSAAQSLSASSSRAAHTLVRLRELSLAVLPCVRGGAMCLGLGLSLSDIEGRGMYGSPLKRGPLGFQTYALKLESHLRPFALASAFQRLPLTPVLRLRASGGYGYVTKVRKAPLEDWHRAQNLAIASYGARAGFEARLFERCFLGVAAGMTRAKVGLRASGSRVVFEAVDAEGWLGFSL